MTPAAPDGFPTLPELPDWFKATNDAMWEWFLECKSICAALNVPADNGYRYWYVSLPDGTIRIVERKPALDAALRACARWN